MFLFCKHFKNVISLGWPEMFADKSIFTLMRPISKLRENFLLLFSKLFLSLSVIFDLLCVLCLVGFIKNYSWMSFLHLEVFSHYLFKWAFLISVSPLILDCLYLYFQVGDSPHVPKSLRFLSPLSLPLHEVHRSGCSSLLEVPAQETWEDHTCPSPQQRQGQQE